MAKKTPLYTKIFKWTIANFTEEAIEKLPTGKLLKSSIFCILVGDEATKWSLCVYPNGSNENNKNNIEIYLRNHNLDDMKNKSAFQASYSAGIKRDGVRNDFIGNNDQRRRLDEFKNDFRFIFMSHTELFDPNNGYINDGKLSLFSQVTITKTSENVIRTEDPWMNSIMSYFKKIKPTSPDLEIKTSDGETLTAHKMVMAARSPWFNDAMLRHEGKFVYNSEFNSKIMNELLRFVYCNEVENLNEIADVLIHAAEKYQIEDLKKMCQGSLSKTVTAENVFEYLAIADRLSDMDELFDKCLETFISNYRQVKQSEEWTNFSKDLKLKIMQEAFERTSNCLF